MIFTKIADDCRVVIAYESPFVYKHCKVEKRMEKKVSVFRPLCGNLWNYNEFTRLLYCDICSLYLTCFARMLIRHIAMRSSCLGNYAMLWRECTCIHSDEKHKILIDHCLVANFMTKFRNPKEVCLKSQYFYQCNCLQNQEKGGGRVTRTETVFDTHNARAG